MAITLRDGTGPLNVINTCDSITGFTGVGNASGVANDPGTPGGTNNNIPPKEGTSSNEWEDSNGTPTTPSVSGIRTPTFTAVDITQSEISLWFLNPKANEAEAELLEEADDALLVRVYSSQSGAERFADYWQYREHRLGDGKWRGGWMILRVSGDAGTEDASGGTGSWSTADAQNVTSLAVIVSSTADNTDKNALEYHIDYIKSYDRVRITGTETLQDIFDESESQAWGIIQKNAGFYKFFCGIEVGDGATTAGTLNCENEYIHFDHTSADVKFPFLVQSNGTVNFGNKNVQTQATYSQDGVQLVASEFGLYRPTVSPPKAAPPFDVESGGVLNSYACLIQGFGTVNLGQNGSTAFEILFGDLYDNDEIEMRSTGLTIEDTRMHFDSADTGDIGAVYSIPNSLKRIRIFNCTDGWLFRVTMTGTNAVEEYIAVGDTTNDIAILDNQEVDFTNSVFDATKLKRVL